MSNSLNPTTSDSEAIPVKPVKKLFDRPANASVSASARAPENTTSDDTVTTAKITLPKSTKSKKPTSANKKPQEKRADNSGHINVDGILGEHKSPNVYGLAMLVLILMMLWTGVLVIEQVQNYHAKFSELQKLKREHRKLEIEHQRLLIEQQTFSATPQIAKRAVAELNMYYPQLSDRMIIQSNTTNAPVNVASAPTSISEPISAPVSPSKNGVTP